jgi:MoxR-like ATPase
MPFSNDTEAVEFLHEKRDILLAEIARVIVGQKEVINELLMALICGGHSLLMGVPGLAKTSMIRTFARLLDLKFRRIQFTPDLMPSDITGTDIIEENRTTGRREFRFVKGPLFGNVVLADEINRTPPKTQAALLEAMQEHRVTAGGNEYELPPPFFVLATQNPIEQEGTYPLPEAQLDRFMFMITVDYPQGKEELEIVKTTTSAYHADLKPVLNGKEIIAIQDLVRRVPIADEVAEYAIAIVKASRPKTTDRNLPKEMAEYIDSYVAWGAGPRASQYLVLGGKARAILDGRYCVSKQDIRSVALPVLRHRIITNFHAEADGINPPAVVRSLLSHFD